MHSATRLLSGDRSAVTEHKATLQVDFFSPVCNKCHVGSLQLKTLTDMLHIANPIYDSAFKYLERMLDVFCQDRKDGDNSQILTVSEDMMDDEDTRRIVTRLLSAASDNQVRHSMNIEEEIFTALENRDTEIMLYKKEASDAKKEASDAKREASDAKIVINKQSEQLNKQSQQLDKQSRQLQAAIRMLYSNGMDRGQIASALGISDKDVDGLLQSDT